MDFAPREVVAARMRDARKAKGLDQHEIASEVGVTQPAVCAWESAGQMPKKEMWPSVAAAYGMTMLELFFDAPRAAEG